MASKGKRRPVADRFWAKVSGGDFSDCWNWSGARSQRTGYGTFKVELGAYVLPHRFAYEQLRADIPVGLQIDHLCRNRACVNPWHMEPVTARVNVRRSHGVAAANARRTHCVNGHPFDNRNTGLDAKRGKRWCRTCHALRERSRRAARRTSAERGGDQ